MENACMESDRKRPTGSGPFRQNKKNTRHCSNVGIIISIVRLVLYIKNPDPISTGASLFVLAFPWKWKARSGEKYAVRGIVFPMYYFKFFVCFNIKRCYAPRIIGNRMCMKQKLSRREFHSAISTAINRRPDESPGCFISVSLVSRLHWNSLWARLYKFDS